MKKPVETPDYQEENRERWRQRRAALESRDFRKDAYSSRGSRWWRMLAKTLPLFELLLKATGLYNRGVRNAGDLQVRRVAISFPDLPQAFDGYKILHLTDLHLDSMPGVENIIIRKIENLAWDLCVMTGDYRAGLRGGHRNILPALRKLIRAIISEDGLYGIFGNHDTWRMLHDFEAGGMRVLVNETVDIRRQGQRIRITGTDDPHDYDTAQVRRSLETGGDGFKIALIHTPELYREARENGYQLYLCGHTHGGQICLPGGKPVITHLHRGRRFYGGLWRYKGMTGYTGRGCGTVDLPVRFFCPPEATLITLSRTSG